MNTKIDKKCLIEKILNNSIEKYVENKEKEYNNSFTNIVSENSDLSKQIMFLFKFNLMCELIIVSFIKRFGIDKELLINIFSNGKIEDKTLYLAYGLKMFDTKFNRETNDFYDWMAKSKEIRNNFSLSHPLNTFSFSSDFNIDFNFEIKKIDEIILHLKKTSSYEYKCDLKDEDIKLIIFYIKIFRKKIVQNLNEWPLKNEEDEKNYNNLLIKINNDEKFIKFFLLFEINNPHPLLFFWFKKIENEKNFEKFFIDLNIEDQKKLFLYVICFGYDWEDEPEWKKISTIKKMIECLKIDWDYVSLEILSKFLKGSLCQVWADNLISNCNWNEIVNFYTWLWSKNDLYGAIFVYIRFFDNALLKNKANLEKIEELLKNFYIKNTEFVSIRQKFRIPLRDLIFPKIISYPISLTAEIMKNKTNK